jgi:hypothetical protein
MDKQTDDQAAMAHWIAAPEIIPPLQMAFIEPAEAQAAPHIQPGVMRPPIERDVAPASRRDVGNWPS